MKDINPELTGEEYKLARKIIEMEIIDKGVCPSCGTILSEDTDGTLYCKGCGLTATGRITNYGR